MKGVVILGNRQLEIRDFPVPTPNRGQVLIKPEVTTICGSDINYFKSTPEELGDRATWIAGHEVCGRIVKLGDCISDLKEGDRVSVFHLHGCGFCEMCRKGYPQYCTTPAGSSGLVKGQATTPWKSSGTFADFLLAPANVCLKMPNDISPLTGAILGCSGLTAYNAIDKLRITSSDTVAVYGLGPVGLCAVVILNALGIKSIGIDLSQERIALAEDLGVNEVINAQESNPVDEINTITGGCGTDASLDFSGNRHGILNAIRSVKNFGKVCLIGAGRDINESFISPASFMSREVWITGIHVSGLNSWFDLVRLMRLRKFSFDKVVTHSFPLSKVREAFELWETLKAGKIALTVND